MTDYNRIKTKFKRTVPHNSDNMRRIYDEPTYLGFKILFHFNDNYSPLLNKTEHSAYNYLIKNGHTKQAEQLDEFISTLQYVSRESEFYFQTLEGLSDIWGYDFIESKLRVDKKLTIGTLEGLDLRISKILDYYYKAMFDTNNRREIVPENLRYFSMSIYITDVRTFHTSYVDTLNGALGGKMDISPENAQQRAGLFFRLDNCEFDKLSKINILDTVSNTEFTQAANKIVIKHFGEITEYPEYIIHDTLNQDTEQKPQDILSPAITNKINDVRANINAFGSKSLLNSVDAIGNKISATIMPLVLGNVYKQSIVRDLSSTLSSGLSIGGIL